MVGPLYEKHIKALFIISKRAYYHYTSINPYAFACDNKSSYSLLLLPCNSNSFNMFSSASNNFADGTLKSNGSFVFVYFTSFSTSFFSSFNFLFNSCSTSSTAFVLFIVLFGSSSQKYFYQNS